MGNTEKAPQEEQVSLPDNNYPSKQKEIPISRLLELAQQGLHNTEIALIVGCKRQNVDQRLQPYRSNLASLPKYKKRKLDLLALCQKGFIEEIIRRLHDPDYLKNVEFRDLFRGFGTLVDKEQILKGKHLAGTSAIQVNINFDPALLPGGSTGMIIEGEQGTPELGITFDDQYKQDDTGGDAPPPQPEGEDVST